MWMNMKISRHTFCHVPDIIIVCDVVLPEELLYLWVTVSDNAVKSHTTCIQQCQTPLQALLLHVIATTDLIALYPRKETPKIIIIIKCIMNFIYIIKYLTNHL